MKVFKKYNGKILKYNSDTLKYVLVNDFYH